MIKYKLKEQGIDVIDTILTNRNLTMCQVKELLNPKESMQHDGMVMKNMGEGLNLLHNAIISHMNIGIVCDPDVDGLGATSSLENFIINKIGYKKCQVLFHKNPKSHGLDEDILKKVIKNNIQLLILPDAGSSKQDLEMAKQILKLGVKILIIDHHIAEYDPKDLDIVMINPNQEGCLYENKNLSGCGVTYKFIHEYAKKYSVKIKQYEYIDIVALTLISDMMDMKNSLENRLLFNIGSLKENISSPMINTFIDSKKIIGDCINIEEYAFTISSMMNATIRVGTQTDKEMLFNAMFKEQMVESKKRGSKGELVPIQDEILRIMTNNKSKQDKKVKEAVQKIKNQINEKGLLKDKVFIFDVGDIIDSSLTGLVANKIMNDVVKRPTMLYRDNKNKEGFVGGSGRGCKVDSLKELCLETNLFEFVSGHDNAQGFEIKKENLEEVRELLNIKLEHINLEDAYEVEEVYNGAVPVSDVKDIAKYEDLWCNHIEEPKFIVKNVKMETSQIEKIGNSTYVFKIGDVNFTKTFGSAIWYESLIHEDDLPFGGAIIADIVFSIRKNKKGYDFCKIIDMKTKINEEEVIDF